MCWQEVEPNIGEALCRLFPPDENIDISRIAKIAKQSLKRPSGSAGKSSATATRSASSTSLPPGLSESSSSRSDMLLLGLRSDDRTLHGSPAAGTSTTAALGTVCTAVCNCGGTYFTDVLGGFCGSCNCAAENASACRMHVMNNLIAEWDTESKITLSAAMLRTLKWTFLVKHAGKLHRLMDWGGLMVRTLVCHLQDIIHLSS